MRDKSNDVEALGGIFMIWKEMEKQFLRVLMKRLAIDVPDFNSEMFMTELHLLQEGMTPDDPDPELAGQMQMSLKFLGELIQVAEEGIEQARLVQEDGN